MLATYVSVTIVTLMLHLYALQTSIVTHDLDVMEQEKPEQLHDEEVTLTIYLATAHEPLVTPTSFLKRYYIL